MSEPIALTVRILDKDFQVACPEAEQAALLNAAQLLDTRMREIRDSGRVIGLDRMALMVALNLAHELLQSQAAHDDAQQHTAQRIKTLQGRIDTAVQKYRQLEL